VQQEDGIFMVTTCTAMFGNILLAPSYVFFQGAAAQFVWVVG
jgi:hypothetical protein